jgi:glycosyltransferase involved in cell wall biosynthesis
MLSLSRFISDKCIDLVNAHHYMTFIYSFLGTRVFNKISLVYTEHSVPEVENIRGIHKHLFNILMCRTNAVIGVSAKIAETFKTRFPIHHRKIHSILNGIDINSFSLNIDRQDARIQWGFKPNDFIIGVVANFRNVKNHVCLIRAFHSLSSLHPEARLFLVGRGQRDDPENSEEKVRQLIQECRLGERVVIAGYQTDIPRLLQIMDIFCLPSVSEGMPVSILEAMAARIPVVGSDVRGINEIISADDTGLLFPSNNHIVLTSVIGLRKVHSSGCLRHGKCNRGLRNMRHYSKIQYLLTQETRVEIHPLILVGKRQKIYLICDGH